MNCKLCLLILFIVNHIVTSNRCGVQKRNRLRLLIMGGMGATPGDFPWFVELKWVNKDTGVRNSCGATLIRNNWVLTAAHCVAAFQDTQNVYTAYVGVTDLYDRDIKKHQAKVLRAIPHEDYSVTASDDYQYFTVQNDIALIKIDINDLDKDTRLTPICLNDEQVSFTDECWIAGFGDDRNNLIGHVSKLRKMREKLADDQDCLNKQNFAYDSTSQLCVGGSAHGGKGTCHGDSGSAFQCKGKDGRFYQLGVASYLTNVQGLCAQPDSPDVYMKVSHYVDWIEEKINQDSFYTLQVSNTGNNLDLNIYLFTYLLIIHLICCK